MKKMLSMIMAIAMVSNMATMVVFAADGNPVTLDKEHKSTSIDVTAKTIGDYIPSPAATFANNDSNPDPDPDPDDQTKALSEKAGDRTICVDIEWGDMNFIYDFSTPTGIKWDTENLCYGYEYEVEPCWKSDTADIKVTNRSDCDIKADVKFVKNDDINAYEYVEVSFDDKTSAVLKSGLNHKLHSETFTLSVCGAPSEYVKESAPLGTVNVTISEPESSGSITGGSLDGGDNDT